MIPDGSLVEYQVTVNNGKYFCNHEIATVISIPPSDGTG